MSDSEVTTTYPGDRPVQTWVTVTDERGRRHLEARWTVPVAASPVTARAAHAA
jgi:hypothetical protein